MGCGLDLPPGQLTVGCVPTFPPPLNTSGRVYRKPTTRSIPLTPTKYVQVWRPPMNRFHPLSRVFATHPSVWSEQSAAAERNASSLSCGGWGPTRRSPTTAASPLCSTPVQAATQSTPAIHQTLKIFKSVERTLVTERTLRMEMVPSSCLARKKRVPGRRWQLFYARWLVPNKLVCWIA